MKTSPKTTCTLSGLFPCANAKLCLLNQECFHCAFAQWLEAMSETVRKADPGPAEEEIALAAAA